MKMQFNKNNIPNFGMNMNMFNPNLIQPNPVANFNQNQMFNNGNPNMMNQNQMPFNNINMNIMPNMNMMNNNNQFGNNFGNINGNNFVNNFPQNNNMNNNMNFNNMNFNNNNNNNSQNIKNLKKKLLKNSLALKDPYQIQLSIALGLNNDQPYEHYVQGGNKVPDFMKQSSVENPVGVNDNKINVVFVVMKGNSHSRVFNQNDTIKDMLTKFIKSRGLHEYHLKDIYFLFNAVNLNTINQNQTLKEIGIKNGTKITIIDLKDIIGA
jgi:hypothetical protein